MEASTTEFIEEIMISTDVMLPLETSSFTYSEGSTTIDSIINDYFSVFPASYLLVFVAIGIMAVLIYTLYSYLDN
jgi:hypothetical protein